jgi:transketolase
MAMTVTNNDLALAANTIRGLAIDGVQKAKSGHPGMPMGMADVAAVLFLKHLIHSPTDPSWVDRDRFVLSAGHGSMLIYSLLHLAGYDLPLEELKAFRQWQSKTPGHPEYGVTPGVETTTGPLGQGCGNAVGMALAERMLAARLNTSEYTPLDHHTYVIASDGEMMEGLSHEAFALAGHLALNRLIVFYDYNHITIEGATDLAYSDDVKRRFQSYHWNVIEIDGHDYDAIEKAIRKAKREKNRPTIIITHTRIGKGSPNKEGTSSSHGEPLGDEEVILTKRALGLPENESFFVPDAVRELFAARARSLKRKASKWQREWKKYASEHADWAARWKQFFEDEIPEDLESCLPAFATDTPVATRSASGKVIQALAEALPQFVGGSADLAPSTKTLIDGADSVGRGSYAGRNFHFGIREHAMTAMLNGIVLHGGLRPFGATFFVFLDYCRPSVRLAAIMGLPVIYVFTHDSYNVGEDGPTHQPVEQLASLRCIPNMTVIRPSDPGETGPAWLAALRNKEGPTALLLTRQNLAVIDRTRYADASNLAKGGYVLWQSGEGVPDVIILASGSEVGISAEAAERLATTCNVRIVSMPSMELFAKQEPSYRDAVLPAACTQRLVVEAGVEQGWGRYLGSEGRSITMTDFGSSGPYQLLAEKFRFTADNIVAVVNEMLG